MTLLSAPRPPRYEGRHARHAPPLHVRLLGVVHPGWQQGWCEAWHERLTQAERERLARLGLTETRERVR